MTQREGHPFETESAQISRREGLKLAAGVTASLVPIAALSATQTKPDDAAIRSFQVSFPKSELTALRQRIKQTRWPDRETVANTTQGVQLATTQKLAQYWSTAYDWGRCEARLNALPQFITELDGLDIHFIHVRSKHTEALPMIITHGWPGSIIEQLKIIEPLTNPTAHGGTAADAFHLVIPSLPGYGFSGKPTAPGWQPVRIAQAWTGLMKRLGYTKFVAQGGDWGNAVSETMALQAPPGLLAIHTNMPATVPAEISKALADGDPPPTSLTAEERNAWDQLDFFYKKGLGYANEMTLRPADALWHRGFTGRPGRVDARSRCAQLRSHRRRLRREVRRPEPRRHSRQHDALLVDEHRDLVSAPLVGHGAGSDRRRLLRREARHDARRSERLPR